MNFFKFAIKIFFFCCIICVFSENNIFDLSKPTLQCEDFNKNSEKFGQLSIEKHLNYSNRFIQLIWTGINYEKVLIVTDDRDSSHVFLSKENWDFTEITNRLWESKKDFLNLALIQHPFYSEAIFLLSLSKVPTILFISKNGGESFEKHILEFDMSQQDIVFHPKKFNCLLALDSGASKLYRSIDFGDSWVLVDQNVTNAQWVFENHELELFYLTFDNNKNFLSYTLKKFTANQKNIVIKKFVHSFVIEKDFIYASIYLSKETNERILQVSSDNGESWSRVQLPSITSDRFYSVLDASEQVIMMHVDNPGDNGSGVLFTSDATGIVFSKSLNNHFYPNFDNTNDFYKVSSTLGTYITNTLQKDDSIVSKITFDHGSEWHLLSKPKETDCLEKTTFCSLHVHNRYSIKRGVNCQLPLSIASAPGLILVHGHVAESLHTHNPDVYVSEDGGRSWFFSLKGPHFYNIADNGGLLLAIPISSEFVDTIKFSTDRGHCWVIYKFTSEKDLTFKSLLVAPENKHANATLWAVSNDSRWHIFIFNFSKINQCVEENFEKWQLTTHNGSECVLGIKRTYKRTKPSTLCLLSEFFNPLIGEIRCPCSQHDYACDYGYVRENEKCVKDLNVVEPINICHRKHQKEIVPKGYHLIPGVNCQGGFQPETSEYINLTKECKNKWSSHYEDNFSEGLDESKRKPISHLWIYVFLCLLFTAVLVSVGFVKIGRKYMLLIKAPRYKYTVIGNRDDTEDSSERLLINQTTDSFSSSSSQTSQILSDKGFIHPKLFSLLNLELQKEKLLSDVEMIQ